MRAVYLDMIGGASGNMLLGALVDAGADLAEVERALRTIPVPKPWTLESRRVNKRGIAATLVEILVPGEDGSADHSHVAQGAPMRLSDVLTIIDQSGLEPHQRKRARLIYERLAAAEARVHGTELHEVHFHEVGQTDAILDVAATCVALDLLRVKTAFCSAFPLGSGRVDMQHGTYPNPPPATAELLRGFETIDGGVRAEMVTTTGAAIITALATQAERRPRMRCDLIGYGAGTSDFPIPNVLAAWIGDVDTPDRDGDVVAVLEANIDDMQPQHFELAMERVFAAGALDVWLIPVTMKKSRPGIQFGAIAPLNCERECAHAMLAETTTLGVRVRQERRYTLERCIEEIDTPLGRARVKIAVLDGTPRRTFEYEDLARIAREHGLPLAEVARILGKTIENI